MKKSLMNILRSRKKVISTGLLLTALTTPLFTSLSANTPKDTQTNQKNIPIESVTKKQTINQQLYTDSRAQIPDTLLGLSTSSPGYWVNFKDRPGEDFDNFESTSTPNPLSRDGPDNANKLNPYLQPNTNLTDSYGSLDVNQDGFVDGVDYSYLVNYQPQIDEADIDGNGIPSEQADIDLAYAYLTAQTDHLPGYGNQLIGQEVIDWNASISAIDLTDEIPFEPIVWDCEQYSTQDMINNGNYVGADIDSIYDQSNINRFNNKEYMLEWYDKATGIGHMMNVFFTRDGNSTDTTKWWGKEPQTDQIMPLTTIFNNLPENYRIIIQAIKDFSNPYNPEIPVSMPLLAWDKDSTGINLIFQRPNLITSMPQDMPIIEPTLLGIDNEKDNISTSYNLGQNYPNPFNAHTNINYNLSFKENVRLDVYDVRGNNIETLVNQIQEPGKHTIKFDGSKYSSGSYIYELKSGDKTEYKIMTILK